MPENGKQFNFNGHDLLKCKHFIYLSPTRSTSKLHHRAKEEILYIVITLTIGHQNCPRKPNCNENSNVPIFKTFAYTSTLSSFSDLKLRKL